MRNESSKDIIKRLTSEGWYLARVKGSQYQFKHQDKESKVTVQHPKDTIYGDTLISIYRQAEWKW
jgi:predicted RNA binding protein YcfA (HicA-like mRNA interferase family)